MVYWTGTDMADAAVLEGGPMDGSEHPVEADVDELVVAMTDGQLHRYDRTDRAVWVTESRDASVFLYQGRITGRRLGDRPG